MIPFLIGIDEETSLDLIARITNHLPIGASLGRIEAVSRDGVNTAGAAGESCGPVFGLAEYDDYAWRVVDLGCGLSERTCWRDGQEIGRHVVRATPLADDADAV